MKKIALISIVLVFSLAVSNLLAQTKAQRPKVGLVLSGGGAKGMAHIGVIKAMEEAGLYPDYITGTSMGSIIGALYAIGYSADEIKELSLAIKWEDVLTNDIPLDKVAFEEKSFYGRYFIELPIQNKKIGLPQGLIEGQELTMLLNKITRPAHGITDFHKLPIPFECIAADIETGKAVVLKSGSLALAMRASMSIPTFFTPTTIDSTLYVDGGLIRNFPVQEAIDMGADIIIGVFVSSDLAKKEDLTNMVSILAQSAFVFSAHDSNEQTKLVDIYIEPDLTGYSTASFWDGAAIIKKGEEAGEKFAAVFKQLADSLDKFGPVRVPKKLPVNNDYSFKTISIKGNEKVPDELIIGKLRIAENTPINIDELEKRINLLYGTLYFSKVLYSIDEVNSELNIIVKEAPKNSIKVAAHYDSDNKAGINLNLTSRNFLLPSSRFIMEYDLAQNPRVDINYFKYLGKKQNMAVVLNAAWLKYDLPSYWSENKEEKNQSDNELSSLFQDNSINLSVALQGTYRSNVTFGAKLEYLNHSISPIVSDSINSIGIKFVLDKLSTKDWGTQVYLRSNTLNKPFFATKGIRTDLRAGYLFDRNFLFKIKGNDFKDVDNPTGEIEASTTPEYLLYGTFNLQVAVPIFKKITFLYGLSLRLSNGTTNLEDFPFRTFIGGERPVGTVVYRYEATPAKRFDILNVATATAALQWEFHKDIYLTVKADYLESQYPMKWIDKSMLIENIGAFPRRLGFSGKLSYDSMIGPISIGIGKDQYLSGVHGFFGFGYYLKQ
ncbi:MAG: patatin-like phospholipase family protein [Cyclobacteriaceae bacterium]|nr:patatin-like phospholipase family protein [Cyclobacteriaceae bacterium]